MLGSNFIREKRHKEKNVLLNAYGSVWDCTGIFCIKFLIICQVWAQGVCNCEVITLIVCSATDDNAKKQYFSAKSYFIISFNLLVTLVCISALYFNPWCESGTTDEYCPLIFCVWHGIDNFIHNRQYLYFKEMRW